MTRRIPKVSPLRGIVLDGYVDVVIRRSGERAAAATVGEPSSVAVLATDDEPPMPDEVARVTASMNESATVPVSARAGQSLHVSFQGGDQDQLLTAFGTLRQIIHDHPGDTQVVLHIPAGGGRSQRMELRFGVAYDTELIAALERQLGRGLLDLRLLD